MARVVVITVLIAVLVSGCMGPPQEKMPGEWFADGLKHAEQGDVDDAIADFTEVIKLDPKSTAAYYHRGQLHRRNGEIELAKADFDEVLRLDPNHAPARHARAEIYRSFQDFGKADSEDQRAAHQKGFFYYMTMGRRASDQGDYQRALRNYKEAFRLKPRSPEVLNDLAWLLATCPDSRIRDGKKAVDHGFQAALLTGWKDASVLDTLAAAYAEDGRFEDAVKTANKALTLAKANVELRSRLALYERGQPFRVRR
jgi:tetratricopeptide (TPR) repeat protein